MTHNLNTQVVGWNRFLQLVSIFRKEFRLTLEATAASGEDTYNVWVTHPEPNKLHFITRNRYRDFIRGVLAASYFYDPMSTHPTPEE